MIPLNNGIIRFSLVHKINNDSKIDTVYSVGPQQTIPEDFNIITKNSLIEVITKNLIIQIHCSPLKINIYDSHMESVVLQSGNSGFFVHKKQIQCINDMSEQDHFYGFGEKTGTLDKRISKQIIYPHSPLQYGNKTDPLYMSIPFFLQINKGKSYGLLLDSSWKSYFDMGYSTRGKQYIFGSECDELNYYIITDKAHAVSEIIKKMIYLTGRPQLPDKKFLGLHQSKWSYKNDREIIQVAKTYRQKKIPCDILYLDIDYMNGYRVFTWNKKRFPHPEQMLEKLHEMGFKVVSIVDPGVKKDKHYSVYQQGTQNDYWCKNKKGQPFVGFVWPGKTVFPDFTRQEVQNWWGQLYCSYLDQGIAGFWLDMNEPVLNILKKILLNKDDGNMFFYDHNQYSPLKKIKNLYGHLMSLASYNGILNYKPNTRPFLLIRSGFFGTQKVACKWTGDNHSSWKHLALSISMLLNLGLSGIGFVGADIGGFFGIQNMLFRNRELFIRWIQLGVFYPLCRIHSSNMNLSNEPWRFGRKVEKIAKQYIQLRYSLIPYIYHYFREYYESGRPIMAPLFFDYSNDEVTYTLNEHFLFGEELLVAPITKKGVKNWKVYLPGKKDTWINWWTKKEYKGNNWINLKLTDDNIPLFIKKGAIIPKQYPDQYISNTNNNLVFEVYPPDVGQTKILIFYEDDNTTLNYLKNIFCKTKLEVRTGPDKMELIIHSAYGEYDPKRASYQIHFYLYHFQVIKAYLNNQKINIIKTKNSDNLQDKAFISNQYLIIPLKNNRKKNKIIIHFEK